MKKVFGILKKVLNPLPLAMVMSFLLALVIRFWGEKLQFRGVAPFGSADVRFWTVLALVFTGTMLALVLAYRKWREWRASRVEKAAREPTPEELESAAMDQMFSRALKVIRARWLGAGQKIYTLPWYLVIGTQGAGKTALVDNGDMRFPIDHEIRAEVADQSARLAHDFVTWRVAGNEAVLLEIDGAQLVAHEARSTVQTTLWDRFMTNLQRARPRRPVNGIILVIDVLEFSRMTLAAREDYASLIRRTVNDLVERLGTRLTVHVVFTKLDLMAGFVDFFENLSARDREQLFGFHFLYEGKHTPAWLDQLDTQYSDYLDKLHRQITRRLSALKGAQSRQEAFSFYRDFAGLQAPLRSFLESALGPDKFSTAPLVRGLYFTSARQENAPHNVFLEAVGERYNLPEPLYGVPQGASHPYFVTELFKKAIFPEAGLAGNNLKAEARYQRNARWLAVAGVVGCVLGGGYWYLQYRVNLGQAQSVLDRAQDFASSDQAAQFDPTGHNLLASLDTIRAATLEFGNYREANPVAAQLSLYQGDKIGPIADAAYRRALNDQFVPVLVKGVAQELRNVCPKGSKEQLDYLRVYRMLGDLDGRDNRVIEKYFRDLWQRNFPADATAQNALAGHLAYALDTVPKAYSTDAALVRVAQADLGRLTPYRRVYSTLRSLAERQLPNALEFRSAVGATFDIVYVAGGKGEQAPEPRPAQEGDSCGIVTEAGFDRAAFEIPRFFSTGGFRDFFVPQVDQVARVAADDLWTLGLLESTNYSDADYEQISTKLREIYMDEYVRTWRQSLNAMQVRAFSDLRDATEILRALSGPDNPIRRIAQLTDDNTSIYTPETVPLDGTEQASSQLPFDPNREAGLQINAAFSDIHRMLAGEASTAQPNADQIQEALAAVYDYVKTVHDAPDPNAKALEMAIARAKLTGDDPIYVLERIAERAPAPFNEHLKFVAQESWRIIMVAATEELNRKWHEEIYGDYQRLIAGKYPFDRQSTTDLPLDDFQAFFKPDGILEKFYQNELLTFVEEGSGKPRVIDGQTLAVDPGFTENLRRAIAITRTFFNASGDLAVEFTVQPAGMSANLSRAVLNFEGQLVVSSHGATRPVQIVWPNIINGPRSARYDLAPLVGTGASAGRQYDGPWAWLRLYDGAQKSGIADNAVDIGFANANGQSAQFRLRVEGQVNPFFNSPLSDFTLPSHLHNAGGQG